MKSSETFDLSLWAWGRALRGAAVRALGRLRVRPAAAVLVLGGGDVIVGVDLREFEGERRVDVVLRFGGGLRCVEDGGG